MENQLIDGEKGCFRAGTLISTSYGSKKIEDINVGDSVLCYNEDGDIVEGVVSRTFKHDINDTKDIILRIDHEFGVLFPTINHWILKDNGQYDDIGNFNVDDNLTLLDGQLSKILLKNIHNNVHDDDKHTYNLSVEPYHVYIADGIRVHNKGSSKSSSAIEEPNTLQSYAVVNIIDLISEGEIEGFVYDDGRSIYLNEISVSSNGSDYNYEYVTSLGRPGLVDQGYLTHLDGLTIGTPVEMGVHVTKAAGLISTPNVIPAGTDFISLLFTVPKLFQSEDDGGIYATDLTANVYVQVVGGDLVWEGPVIYGGKCTSPYQRNVVVKLKEKYGQGPFIVKVERVTEDAQTVKKVNDLYWSSYTLYEIEKFYFPYSAVMSLSVRADQFASVPQRRYLVKGIKCRVPDNYNPVTRVYSGVWSGTFASARVYTNNPAWIILEILTNTRYGYGFDISEVDIASLYSCAVYSDTIIDDGFGSTEPRFTLNTVISASAEGYHLLNLLCSTMRASFYSSGTQIIFTQDRPADPIMNVSNASVVGGMFNYTSTQGSTRHNQVSIQWNDPNDNYKPSREYYDDAVNIRKTGRINNMDTIAFGCTSRGQARRHAKWILDTELYQTESVSFTAGLDHAFVMPGDIISITDENFAITRAGGKVMGTKDLNTVYIDAPFTFSSGQTYQLRLTAPDMRILIYTITNSPGTTNIITVSPNLGPLPQTESNWQIVASNLAPRQFRVISKSEVNSGAEFEITALFHDPNKYARVEQGLYFDQPIYTAIPDANKVAPPSNLTAQMYESNLGTARQFNILLSWTHSTDPRRKEYDIQYSIDNDVYNVPPIKTNGNSYAFENVKTGGYNFRVRTVTLTGFSEWVTYSEVYDGLFPSVVDTTAAADITGLQVAGGGTEWTGRDCEFEWDEITTATEPNFKNYRLEIRKIDDTHLRYVEVDTNRFTYTYAMNTEDNGGSPVRSIKVFVWCKDLYGSLSETPASATFTNPAPTMANTTPVTTSRPNYIDVEWTPNSDLDMSHYVVYAGSTNPPTEAIGTVIHPDNMFQIFGVGYGVIYYIQIEPYDAFGVGVKSVIESGVTNKIPAEDLEVELSARMEYSTNDSTDTATIQKLYDFWNTTAVDLSGSWPWVKVDFGVERQIDGIHIKGNNTLNVCFAISRDGDTWSYLGGNAQHALDTTSGDVDRLVSYGSLANAQTNYLQITANQLEYAFFPNGINFIARYCMAYINGGDPYVVRFDDMIAAEKVYARYLSTITGNIGTLTTGLIQSTAYPASGLSINVDNGAIIGKVTFSSGSTGYANIDDKPSSLNNINSTEYNNLVTAVSNASAALSAAATAQSTADGKIKSFYQTSQPSSGMAIGDFWVDTDAGNKLYRYSGSAWVEIQDDAIATAINAAQTAQTTADGKAIVYYQTAAPAGASTGDLWYDTDSPAYSLYRYSGSSWVEISTRGAKFGTNITGGATTGGYVDNNGKISLSTDGKTTINGSTIEIRDAANTLRVKLGKLN